MGDRIGSYECGMVENEREYLKCLKINILKNKKSIKYPCIFSSVGIVCSPLYTNKCSYLIIESVKNHELLSNFVPIDVYLHRHKNNFSGHDCFSGCFFCMVVL